MNATTHEITDFDRDVLERSRRVPVLVDFWATWCGPCRVLGPVLERLAAEADGRWVLAKVDTEAHPDLAERYGIQGIPNCKLFVGGEVVDEFTGALPEPHVRRWLDQALPSPVSEALALGTTLLEQGRFYEAALALRAAIEQAPGDEGARVLLARALLRLAPEQVEATLAPVGEDSEQAPRAAALRTLARVALLEPTPEALPEGPAKVHVLDGARALRAGDWDGALAAFIAAMRAQRGYADGLPAEAGRAVFRLLGIEHPACEKHHRAFASALNV